MNPALLVVGAYAVALTALSIVLFIEAHRRIRQLEATVVDLTPASCRVCGCTDNEACWPNRCWWVEPDLCSACDPTPEYSKADRADGLSTRRHGSSLEGPE